MKTKTPEQVVAQKAIVCLYLRKRGAVAHLSKLRESEKTEPMHPTLRKALDEAKSMENEAHNALEAIKRVLWYDNWD